MNPAANHVNQQQQAQVPPHGQGPSWVAEQFIQKYYEVLEKHPKYVYRFYNDPENKSTLTVIDMNEDRPPNPDIGMEAIQERVAVTIQGAVAKPDFVDAQFSVGGGVFLQVCGSMQLKGVSPRKFVQTFFLATQERGYYVLNDIVRIFPSEKGTVEARVPENGYTAPSSLPSFGAVPPHPVSEHPVAAPVAVEPAAVQRSVETPVVVPTIVPTAAAAPYSQAAEPAQSSRDLPKPTIPAVAPAPAAATAVTLSQPAPQTKEPTVPTAASSAVLPPKQAAAAPPQAIANLNWAERVKLNLQQAKEGGSTPTPPVATQAAAKTGSAPVQTAPAGPSGGRGVNAVGNVEKHEERPHREGRSNEERAGKNKTTGIYINKLPKEVTVADLEAAFGRFGAFGGKGAWLAPSNRFGTVAYIEYESMESVEAAIKEGNDHKIHVKEQQVNVQQMWAEYSSKQGPREDMANGERSGLPRKNSAGSFKGGRGFGGEGGRGRNSRSEGERRGRFQGSRGRGRGGREGGREGGKEGARPAAAESKGE